MRTLPAIFRLQTTCFLLLTILLTGCLPFFQGESLPKASPEGEGYVSEIILPEAKSNFAYAQYRLLAAEGRWDEALEALERAVAFDRDSRYLQTKLAKAYLHTKQQQKSIEVLRALLQQYPEDADAHELIGDLLLNQNEPAEAAGHYRQALDLQDAHDSLRLKLALALARQGDLPAAIEETLALLEEKPDSVSARLTLARFYKDNQQISEAIDIYRDLLETNPEQMQILLELGALLEEQGRVGDALELYRDGLERDPRSIAVRDQMVRLLIAESRYPEALQIMQEMNDLHPNRVQILGKIGLLQLEMERWAEAELTFRKILRLKPDDERSFYYLGMALSGAGDYPAALEELSKVGPDAEVYLDAVTQRAFLYQRIEQPQQAIDLLEQQLEGGIEEPIIFYYLSSAYASMERWDAAEEVLRKALDRYPDDVNLRYQLGVMYEKLERREDAKREMLRILEIDPDYADALNYIAYVKAEEGTDLEQALEEATRALSLKEAGYIMDTLGWVYFRLGRYDEGRHYLEQAHKETPDDPVILEHLGDLYSAMGLWPDAEKAYTRALELDPSAEGVREKLGQIPSGDRQ